MEFSNYFFYSTLVFTLLTLRSDPAVCEVVNFDSSNLDSIINGNQLVIVNFYADWCRFSRMLGPVFEEAEQKIREKFVTPGQVVLAKVDCDKEGSIAAKYQVSKYPTLKIFKFGQVMKKEYRGQRSADAFLNFVSEQLENPIEAISNMDELDNLHWHKRHIIGYFDSEESGDYAIFKKVASLLKGDCDFISVSGPVSERERIAGNKVVYRPAVENYNEMVYSGLVHDFDIILKWTTDKCIPLVREITFENAEELTEEGLPFMILFHDPKDVEIAERFRKQIATELVHERDYANFLIADGYKFVHPLHHLGKSAGDLPVIAIDSFKHMYLWRRDVKTDLETKGLLLKFLEDLKTGKLHREFHYGPDSTPRPLQHSSSVGGQDNTPPSPSGHIPHEVGPDEEKPGQTSPPESLFKKLAPSRTRYTILKDEL